MWSNYNGHSFHPPSFSSLVRHPHFHQPVSFGFQYCSSFFYSKEDRPYLTCVQFGTSLHMRKGNWSYCARCSYHFLSLKHAPSLIFSSELYEQNTGTDLDYHRSFPLGDTYIYFFWVFIFTKKYCPIAGYGDPWGFAPGNTFCALLLPNFCSTVLRKLNTSISKKWFKHHFSYCLWHWDGPSCAHSGDFSSCRH